MFDKLDKLDADLAKDLERLDTLSERIEKRRERRLAEYNTQVLRVVNASGVTPRELVSILQEADRLPQDFGLEEKPIAEKEGSPDEA